MDSLEKIPFIKMNGLGNDFVIIDARKTPCHFDLEDRRLIADRYRGVGCDQLIFVEPPRDPEADIFMDMYNTDGSPLHTCGNATRCVAHWSGKEQVVLETAAGLFRCKRLANDEITVEMIRPILDWQRIPLAQPYAWDEIPDLGYDLPKGYVVSVGNPHIVFVVEDINRINLEEIGPMIEHHPLFPERINVEFVQILSPNEVRMRVWERGVGVTQACGSGASATGFVVIEKGFVPGTDVTVKMDGGDLSITYKDGVIHMTGPVSYNFEGEYYLRRQNAKKITA